MRSKAYWILFLILIFIGSYYREVLFRSINSIIRGDDFFYAKTMELTLLKDWPITSLVKFKYALTIGFTGFFAFLTALGLKLSFENKTAYYVSIGCYVLLTLISILVVLVGLGFYSFAQVYPILRMFIGWIHSPVLYLFLSISTIAFNSFEIKNDHSR